ncbi:MAG: TonB family protein [Acidobacteriota bacterium]
MAQTILLVDYEPRTLARVTEALAPLGCQIITAKDVDAAVGACARVEPRVVLITSVLPRLKVEDAITQVRARAGLRSTPFIILFSGYAGNDPAGDAIRLGAEALIAKPFSNEELLASVRSFLQAGRSASGMGVDTKADVLEALRRSAGLVPQAGTVTSEDLFGDLIGEGEEPEPRPADTQQLPRPVASEPASRPTPAPPEEPRPSPGETQRIAIETVLQATPAGLTPRAEPAAKPAPPRPAATPAAGGSVESSLAAMLEPTAKPAKVRQDTGGASVDELLHQTLSGLEGGAPRLKPAPPKTVPAPAPEPVAPPSPAVPKAARPAPPPEPVAPAPALGTPFGQYELIETISAGGMAEVFKARMRGVEGFQKIVAIKRILPHLTDNDEFVTMFIDEAKLAAGLQHPNIIHIYDLGRIERSYYIAMEYIDGKDLRSILRLGDEKRLRLPLGLALHIGSRLAAALDYAHRKSDLQGKAMALVHRDVSPQNVLVSFDGDIKLCDFGIAKAASKASHTCAGALKGKLQCMSPEQAWGKDLDHRSDIFSLGLVLYEMITGRKAFAGDSELSILEQVRAPKLVSPRELDATIPADVESVVLKALHPNREERYQTAGEMSGDLAALLQGFRPTPGASELGGFLAELVGRERPAAAPTAPAPPRPKPAPQPTAAPAVKKPKEAPVAPAPAPVAAEPELPEISRPEAPRRPLPIGLIAGVAVGILAVAVGVVVLTRQRSAPAGPAAAVTPAPETVAMARQIAQEEVARQEAALRSRLTEQILAATPAAAAAQPVVPAGAPITPTVAPVVAPAVQTAVPRQAIVPTAAPLPTAVPTAAAVVASEPQEPPAVAPPPVAAPTRPPHAAEQPAVRVGDLIESPDTPAEAVHNPKPGYPPLAARQRVGGTVILRALVDENGAVQDVQILRGIKPDLGLDAAAVTAVRGWRFRPATKDGVRVKVWQTLTLPFRP